MAAEQTVIDLGEARARRSRRSEAEPFPSPLPLDMTVRLLKLAIRDCFTFNEVLFATRTVEYWANGGKGDGTGKIVRKADWPMTIVNAMRLGWGLRGFDKHRSRKRTPRWMDQPLGVFHFEDLVECLEQRRRGKYGYVPRTRCETISNPRFL